MVDGRILAAESGDTRILKLVGDVRLTLCSTLNAYIDSVVNGKQPTAMLVDLSETEALDSTTLGMLAKLSVRVRERWQIPTTLVSSRKDVTRILESMGVAQVFVLIDHSNGIPPVLDEIPLLPASEEQMRTQILEAHRTLMEMNESNRERFRELVEMLEC